MLDRIREALTMAGLPEVPQAIDAPLKDYGLDSLIVVMAVIEFEKTFAIKIPAKEFSMDLFTSLSTLETFLEKQGAK